MATYNINKSDGTLLTTINDGTTDTTTDLVLLGKNYTGYGGFVAENFVYLLENFAKNTSPATPLTGQLWYCKDNASAASGLNVYDGTRFIPLPRFFKADTAPTPAIDGDLWWNRTDKQLFGYNGAAWVLIGPSSTLSQGKTGIYIEDIYDISSNLHTVISLYIKNSRLYVSNQDSEFTPQDTGLSAGGFATIKPGINANASVQSGSIRFAGVATGADNATTVGVSELTESQLMRKDITQTMTEGLIIGNSTVGLTLSGALTITTGGSNNVLKNVSTSKKLTVQNHLGIASIVVHESSNYVGIFKNNPTKALDVTGDVGISGSLNAAGTLIANALGVYSNGGRNWTQTSLTNLSQLTNGPGYITIADVPTLDYAPVRQEGITVVKLGWNGNDLEAYQITTNKGALAFKSDIASAYLGRIADVWQTSSDGRNRILFSAGGATIFGSHNSTYIWKNTANATIATLNSNGNLNLGSGKAWTTSAGPNPLVSVSQLTNDGDGVNPFITSADIPSLGYTPVRQEGATVVKLGWSGSNIKAYSGSTDNGALAFKANIPTNTNQLTNGNNFITIASVPTKTSQLTNDSGFLTSVAVPTKTSDLANDSGFITNATSDGRYIGKATGVSQTSSDGVGRFLFAAGGGTTFGSAAGYTFNSGGTVASISAGGIFTATNDIVAFSDAKLKTNVNTIENALNTVQQLRGVTFTRIDDGRNSLGVIAQEVQKVLPELVNETDGTLGVAYGNMVGLLIEAIKEQQAQINDLQNQINDLRTK